MLKRRRFWLALAALIGVLSLVYFEPSHCVRGWLHGEAFFEGRPTSWWRGEFERWEVVDAGFLWMDLGVGPQQPGRELIFIQRKSTWTERIRAGDWEFWKQRPGRINITNDSFAGPSILAGGPDAEPVLRALADDPSPNVRQLARIGLKLDANHSAE